MKTYFSACKFCGQCINVDAPIDSTDEKVLELATELCKCDEAVSYRKKKIQVANAKFEVEQLFGQAENPRNFKQCGDVVVEHLKQIVDMIADGLLIKSSIYISGCGIATIQRGGNNQITVTRSVTVKEKREIEQV